MKLQRPIGYPAAYARTFDLADGRSVLIRPVVPADLPELARALSRSDAAALRRLFLDGASPRSATALRRLVAVDYRMRFAVAAFAPDGTGVGIARYEGASTWPAVDVAVAVDDRWRGQGLGRELLGAVVQRAVEMGAGLLTADCHAGNARITDLLVAWSQSGQARELERAPARPASGPRSG